jgi:hypothetical protein
MAAFLILIEISINGLIAAAYDDIAVLTTAALSPDMK